MTSNHCLVSIVAIVSLATICVVAVGLGMDGAVVYTAVGAISGIAGYSIRAFNGRKP